MTFAGGELVEHATDWFIFNKDREDSLTIYYEVCA